MKKPPNLHWAIVLVAGLATLGIFGYVWAIVQAVWAKKIDPSSRALTLYIVSVVLELVGFGAELAHASGPVQAVIQLAAVLVATFGAFSVKDTLAAYIQKVERHPAYLSGLMTIFFGEVYLQFHINRTISHQRHATLAPAH